MASRRFQVFRSSSQGEMRQFNQIMPIESPTLIFKRPAMVLDRPAARAAPKTVKKESKPMQQATMEVPRREQQPRKSIFTLGSPERENKTKRDEGFGVFLQACSLCKKKLKLNKDIYMYGYDIVFPLLLLLFCVFLYFLFLVFVLFFSPCLDVKKDEKIHIKYLLEI